jgi:hypothetical protein
MKLVFCKKCHDLFALTYGERSCICGESRGWYVDGLFAEYAGEDAVPVGIANNSFVKAVSHQPEMGQGEVFQAFVIPKMCPTMVRKDG